MEKGKIFFEKESRRMKKEKIFLEKEKFRVGKSIVKTASSHELAQERRGRDGLVGHGGEVAQIAKELLRFRVGF